MGYILCLNSAEDVIQVAICENNKLLVGMEALSKKKGVVLLPKMVKQCLEVAKLDVSNIERISVVVGPGSFTGIRIAISYATGLAYGLNLSLGAINYLALLAQNAFFAVQGEVYVLTSAKINMVNMQGFSGPLPFKHITDPVAIPLNKIDKIVPQNAYVLGSGVRNYLDLFEKQRILDPFFDKPSLESLALLSSQCEYSPNPPTPLYLRASDAEENLPNILKKRGLK